MILRVRLNTTLYNGQTKVILVHEIVNEIQFGKLWSAKILIDF